MLTTKQMRRGLMFAVLMAVVVGTHPTAAQQPQVERKVLIQHDLAVPGYQTTLVEVRIPAGAREGRHTHPGTILVTVEEGALTLDYDGKPTVTYKVGESFFVEPGKIHEGMNRGTTPVRAIASFVVEKGKPLTTQVK